jgi:hypothetical protein
MGTSRVHKTTRVLCPAFLAVQEEFEQFNYHGCDSGCLTSGSLVDYRVFYSGPAYGPPGCPSAWYLTMAIGPLGAVSSTNFDPWCEAWSFSPQYMGETQNTSSNVPGTVSSVANFYDLQIQSVDTAAWRIVPCYLAYVNDVPAEYGANASSCSNTWIWSW